MLTALEQSALEATDSAIQYLRSTRTLTGEQFEACCKPLLDLCKARNINLQTVAFLLSGGLQSLSFARAIEKLEYQKQWIQSQCALPEVVCYDFYNACSCVNYTGDKGAE